MNWRPAKIRTPKRPSLSTPDPAPTKQPQADAPAAARLPHTTCLMTTLTKLRARVSPQAITGGDRIFNGTLDDIFAELFQNARRAGATRVAVTAEHLDDACLITVDDDGEVLLILIVSLDNPIGSVKAGHVRTLPAWASSCLAEFDTVVSSTSAAGSFWLVIAGDAWTGEADIDVLPWMVRAARTWAFHFRPDGWQVSSGPLRCARSSPAGTYNGKDIARADFLADAYKIIERDGFRIGVFMWTGIRRTSRRSISTG